MTAPALKNPAIQFWANRLAEEVMKPSIFDSFYETRRRTWRERLRRHPFRKTERVLMKSVDGDGVTIQFSRIRT